MAFYNADDGRNAYFVSARDLDHAKRVLTDAEVKLHDSAGVPRAVDHPGVCHPTMWMEIDEHTADRIKLNGTRVLSTLRDGSYVRVSKAIAGA